MIALPKSVRPTTINIKELQFRIKLETVNSYFIQQSRSCPIHIYASFALFFFVVEEPVVYTVGQSLVA